MKTLLFSFLVLLLSFSSCKKEAKPIEIYLENERTPFILDGDIIAYDQKESVFTLKNDASVKIKLDFNKKFDLRVGGETIYEGIFWPLYLSSLPDGIAFSRFQEPEIKVWFNDISKSKKDNRNDSRLIEALKNSNRLN
jgi:hypothetical protein